MIPLATLINGDSPGQITAANRGLQYGDGLFETVAVVDGRPLLWDAHMARLQRDAHRLGFDPPPEERLTYEVAALARVHPQAVLKIVVVRAAQGRGYRGRTRESERVVTAWPWPTLAPAGALDIAWCATPLARQPRLAGMKHLNRLEQVLAQNELDPACWEGLMQDTAGWVIEGTMSNVFIVSDGVLATPRLDQAGVAGVMRDQVLHRARERGIPVIVEALSRERVLAADEVFLTNSLMGVRTVRSLPGRVYGPPVLGPLIGKELMERGDARAP